MTHDPNFAGLLGLLSYGDHRDVLAACYAPGGDIPTTALNRLQVCARLLPPEFQDRYSDELIETASAIEYDLPVTVEAVGYHAIEAIGTVAASVWEARHTPPKDGRVAMTAQSVEMVMPGGALPDEFWRCDDGHYAMQEIISFACDRELYMPILRLLSAFAVHSEAWRLLGDAVESRLATV